MSMTDDQKGEYIAWTVEDVCNFAGTENLADAMLQWQRERDSYNNLRVEVGNLRKVQKGLWEIVTLCTDAFLLVANSGVMFLPGKFLSLVNATMLKVEVAKKLAAELKMEYQNAPQGATRKADS